MHLLVINLVSVHFLAGEVDVVDMVRKLFDFLICDGRIGEVCINAWRGGNR